jgi:hypothetical protein
LPRTGTKNQITYAKNHILGEGFSVEMERFPSAQFASRQWVLKIQGNPKGDSRMQGPHSWAKRHKIEQEECAYCRLLLVFCLYHTASKFGSFIAGMKRRKA